jgi:hypothetical protein
VHILPNRLSDEVKLSLRIGAPSIATIRIQ